MDPQKRRIKQRIDLLEDEDKLEQLEVALDMIEAGRGASAALHPDALAVLAEVLEVVRARERAQVGQSLIDNLRQVAEDAERQRREPRGQSTPWEGPLNPTIIGGPRIGTPVQPSETVHLREDPYIVHGVNMSDRAHVYGGPSRPNPQQRYTG